MFKGPYKLLVELPKLKLEIVLLMPIVMMVNFVMVYKLVWLEVV